MSVADSDLEIDSDDSPASHSDDNEGEHSYGRGGYYRVRVGDTFHSSHFDYVIEKKLGWGHFSTVWLATQTPLRSRQLNQRHAANRPQVDASTLVAIKIQKSASQYYEAAVDEIRLLHDLRLSDPLGIQPLTVLLDDFEVTNPTTRERHMALVFQVCGENLLHLIKHYHYRGIPMSTVRILTRQILIGLQYMHEQCSIIHTDLKPGQSHSKCKAIRRFMHASAASAA